MKNLLFILISVCLLGCSPLKQAASLLTCEYSVVGVSDPRIGRISLNGTTDVGRLDAVSLLRLAAGITAGSLPVSATVNVEVVNPNESAASLAGLDWMLMFNDAAVLSGGVSEPLYIEARGSSVVPLAVQADLMEMLRGHSKDEIFAFVNGLLNAGQDDSRVTLRVRPVISVGGFPVQAGYVTLGADINGQK